LSLVTTASWASGRCREFIQQIDPANVDAEVVLSRDRSSSLRELLPLNEWPQPVDRR
jgi:hypothetical protein